MLFLPLQWSFAAVAEYCLHESDAAAQKHVGHHPHEHHDQSKDQSDTGKGKLQHADCATCLGHIAYIEPAAAASVHMQARRIVFSPYSAFIPDPLPRSVFRPPLPILV